MAKLRLEIVADADRLGSLSDAWSELLARSGQDMPTLSPVWVLAWWKLFAGLGGRALRVCAWWSGDRLVALAPLLWRTRRHRGLLPLRRLELLCSGEPEADEVHSEYIGVVVERGFEREAAEALISALVGGRLGEADECLFPLMSGDDGVPPLLRDAFLAAGWKAHLIVASEAPLVPLPSSWEAYLRELPTRRRKSVTRAEADLESWAGEPLQLHVAVDGPTLDRGRAILEQLHAGRWQVAGQQGAFASERFAAFHEAVMPRLLEAGALELIWLEARNEPIAACYNMVWRNKVQHYQAGRRMDIPSHLRPGAAIQARAIRRSIELGRSEYDFLGGATRYKLDFSLASRALVTLSATRPGIRQILRRALDRAAETAGRLRRRVG